MISLHGIGSIHLQRVAPMRQYWTIPNRRVSLTPGATTGFCMSLILIVDDRESDRSQLAAIAEAGGYDVAEAASGEQALKALQETSPDVLILDAEMPGVDGFDVLEQLRQSAGTASLPVIMIGDSVSPGDKARAQQLDVIDFLPKPVAVEAIALRLKWALKSGSSIPALGWDNADLEAQKQAGTEDMSLRKILAAASATAAADYHGREGEYVTEVTPELGGMLETPDGDHSVAIPRGAVPDAVGLHLKPSVGSTVPEAGTLRLRLGSKSVDVRISDRTGTGITGMELGKPARIGIKLDEAPGAGGNTLQEYETATGEWVDVPTVIDPETGQAFTEKSRLGAVGRRRARVLIVEPEAKEAEKMRVSLEGIGCRITFEEVEGQVPARIVNDRPSIVILGIGAAGPLGARLMRRIKSDPATEYVSLIAISHPKDKNGYADALTLGVRDVIKGPVQMGELQFRVSRAYRSVLEMRKLAARRAEALERQRVGVAQRVAPAKNGTRAALQRAAQQALQRRAARAGTAMPAKPVRTGGAPRQRPQRPATVPTRAVRQSAPGTRPANPARGRRSA